MNKIVIEGRLVADPEIKSVGNTKVVSFGVAVTRPYKNKNGERDSDFFDVQKWGDQSAEFCAKYFKKGYGIIISGAMESNIWEDQDGKKRKGWTLKAEEIGFPVGYSGSEGGQTSAPAAKPAAASKPAKQQSDDDDDLPF